MPRPVLADHLTLGGIPVMHVWSGALNGPAPTILFYHGWSSRKEHHLVTAEALAMEGFRVILPDSPRHGDRNPLTNYHTPEGYTHFWSIVTQAISEAAAIAEDAVQAGLAAPERIGAAGSSMGGMIAAGILARYGWAKAAVSLNGCPCYSWFYQESARAKGAPPPPEEELAVLRQFDPEHLVSAVAPRPLLMIHGDADTSVPIAGVRRFAELARPLYAAHPERLVLSEVARLNHYVTVGMVEEMRGWFSRYV